MRGVVGVAALAVACGGGGGGDGATDGGGMAPDGDSSDSVGAVRVLDVRAADPVWPPTGAFVEGWFSATGPFSWHAETAAEGACRLLEFQAGFCEEFCDGVCREPGVCEPWPAYQSAGALEVTGTSEPLSLDAPLAEGGYLLALTIDEPLFGDGDVVTLSAAGDEIPAFDANVEGPPTLEAEDPVGSAAIDVPWEGDFVVEWPNAVPGSSIRVRLIVGGNAHGQPNPFVVECAATDDGSMTIPASLLEPLGSFAASLTKGRDRSALELTRYASASVDTEAGRVELIPGRMFLYAAQRLE